MWNLRHEFFLLKKSWSWVILFYCIMQFSSLIYWDLKIWFIKFIKKIMYLMHKIMGLWMILQFLIPRFWIIITSCHLCETSIIKKYYFENGIVIKINNKKMFNLINQINWSTYCAIVALTNTHLWLLLATSSPAWTMLYIFDHK